MSDLTSTSLLDFGAGEDVDLIIDDGNCFADILDHSAENTHTKIFVFA